MMRPGRSCPGAGGRRGRCSSSDSFSVMTRRSFSATPLPVSRWLMILLSTCFLVVVGGYVVSPGAHRRGSTKRSWGEGVRLESGLSFSTCLSATSSSNEDDDDDDDMARRSQQQLPTTSRIWGNQREPTVTELAVMDEMINKLVQAKPYELPTAVRRAVQVLSSPRFFLRLAQRADAATSAIEKQLYTNLADQLVKTLAVLVSTTQDQLDERAQQVEKILQQAAEPATGEFLVPLSTERWHAMHQALLDLPESSLDEAFLSTLDAYMLKSHQDGLDLMVKYVLQTLLQMAAGRLVVLNRQRLALSSSAPTPNNTDQSDPSNPELAASQFLETLLLQTPAEAWDDTLRQALATDSSSTSSWTALDLQRELQRTMETVVMAQEVGSMSQRVQAEYLTELNKRLENVMLQQQQK